MILIPILRSDPRILSPISCRILILVTLGVPSHIFIKKIIKNKIKSGGVALTCENELGARFRASSYERGKD